MRCGLSRSLNHDLGRLTDLAEIKSLHFEDFFVIRKKLLFPFNLKIYPNPDSDISLSALANNFFLLFSYHHLGAVFFIIVSIVRIPNKFHTPFSLPVIEGCKARRLMANPLSRYSI